MSQMRVKAEEMHRQGKVEQCLMTYTQVAKQFEDLGDYETASYFYGKCLEFSTDFKDLKGEANAYKGLGTCEEKVLNIFAAREYLQDAR